MMKKISNSTQVFFTYSFKGNGKYYITEQGSKSYRNTDFYNFYSRNLDCVNVIEKGNDALRGGKTGDYFIVEFTPNFYTKYQFWFDAKDLQDKNRIELEKNTKECDEILKSYALTNWTDLKELSQNPEFLKEKLNLPIVPLSKNIKKALYTKYEN